MDALVQTPREAMASVAFIHCRIPEQHPSVQVLGEERMGTAVAVGSHHLLTVNYLVMGASEIEAVGFDGQARNVQGVAVDHESGLAVLTVGGSALHPATPGPREVTPGTPVFLLTHADSRQRKGATGHVSVVEPFEAFWEYMLDRAIMTTIVNPGLAGAPLFVATGRLVGIVSLGLGAVGRYSLAIPLALYLDRQAELEGGDLSSLPQKAWVGFYPQGQDGSVVVTGVVPGGPAAHAGIEKGDLILSVDGTPVANLRDLYRAVWKRRPGDPLGMQVLRESAIRNVEVVAGDRQEFYR